MNFRDFRQEHIDELKRRNEQASHIIQSYRRFLRKVQRLADYTSPETSAPYIFLRELGKLAKEAEQEERDLNRLRRQ